MKISNAQQKALQAVAEECRRQASYGNPAQCGGSPKGVRIDTLDALRRVGLVEREYSRLGGRCSASHRYSWSLTPAGEALLTID